MKLLVPLGLLGLLGLLVLLLIYLIKPNYQKRAVSSTYVWKLSFKYRKRRNPINKMREIILLILQIVTIVLCAFLMAQPFLAAFRPEKINQKIAIIDASANMMATSEDRTRFERAVDKVRELAEVVASDNGEMTVILAGEEASFVSVRSRKDGLAALNADLDELVKPHVRTCAYGSGNVEGAMKLAEQVLSETPLADVLFYTGKEYVDKGTVQVVDVSLPGEFNIAILDSVAILTENYYTFEVEVASYGRDLEIMLFCDVNGVNGDSQATTKMRMPVALKNDKPVKVRFSAENTGELGIYAYENACITFSEEDSFNADNTFFIYGGTKETIRIQYCSSGPNIFFRSAIMSLRDTLRARWDIDFVEVRLDGEPKVEGFDFYIFERRLPSTLPQDGVLFLVNPPAGLSSAETGITTSNYATNGNYSLSAGVEHPVTAGIIPENIYVSSYNKLQVSDDYDVVLTHEIAGTSNPVFALRKDIEKKIAVMAFELKNSTISMLTEFPRLIYQTYNYYFPSTVTRYNFEVGESVTVNARAPSLKITGPKEFTLNEFPTEVKLSAPGTYTFSQELPKYSNASENSVRELREEIFVKIPNVESDFATPIATLVNPYIETVPEDKDYDLLLYFAGALVLCLFAEWWLQTRGQ